MKSGLAIVAALAAWGTLAARPAVAGEEGARATEAFGRRYIEAVNSGDRELRLRVAAEVFTPESLRKPGVEALVGQMERLSGEFGALEFHHAEVSAHRVGETESRFLHIYARAAGDARWKDFQCRLDPEPPHRIQQLFFIADVAEPVYLPNGAITDPGTLEWLNGYVDRLAADEDLSGALLVAVGDRPILERSFGFADVDRAVPCTAETRFNLGSGNKMFTALVLAQLVGEGRVSFDTALNRFFPDFPDTAWARRATVGHLLSHTSGVSEYWTTETDDALARMSTLAEAYPLVKRAGIDFMPGEGARYSNSNFILAGLVIEKVTGRDYFDVVRERIYRPCGMNDTDSWRTDADIPDLAAPLTGKPHAWRATRRGSRGSSAGGGYATARDILRYSRALVEGRIVPKSMLAEMTRSHTDHVPGAELDYGYGFIRERSADGVPSFGHGGIARGVNFEYRYFPRDDITLIAFCNQDNGAYDSLRKTVTRLITGER